MTKIPPLVYRFQKFSSITIDALCHDELYFADPESFNDPLDCQPVVRSSSDLKTLRQILFKLIARRIEADLIPELEKAKLIEPEDHNDAKEAGQRRAKYELQYLRHMATNPNDERPVDEAEALLITSEIELEFQMLQDRGVCCFSEHIKNPLLWSHYGDNHYGFSVAYSTNRMPKPELHKVVYGGDRIISTEIIAKAFLEESSLARAELDQKAILRKALPWAYEGEWRLIGDKGLQESCLKMERIYFGLRCPNSVILTIVCALEARENQIEFYRMRVVDDTFELKPKKVYPSEIQTYLPHTAASGIEIFGTGTE